MNFLKIIRSVEWWEFKLPPLLAIGYATVLKADGMFLKSMPHLLFLLLSLIIGAIYVSIINDLTDIDDDLASGKLNRIAGIAPRLRWLPPVICISAGAVCCYYLSPDWLSVCLYIVPWIAFSLYSFRPFRLKNRGIWGVIADASGSHVFTSLLMVSSMSFSTGQPVDWLWFMSTGIWALCYGLRGILLHQFYDRSNDIQAGVNTFAVKISPQHFKTNAFVIFIIELFATITMLFCLQKLLPWLFLLVYVILALTRTYKLKYEPVLIISPHNRSYHILMADFYQVYFPLSLLCIAALSENYAIIALIVHLTLFPGKTLHSLKDLSCLILK